MKNRMPSVIVGIILVIFALMITVIPQFTNCHSVGSDITLPNGMKMPMKCYYSAQGELIAGILLLIVGILMIVGKRKETQMFLTIMGIFVGIATLLLPTYIIGVCADPAHLCNSVMKTTLLILAPLVIIDSVVGLIIAVKIKENGEQ
jgi:uncharacterized membrane protein HdeD (DUF308 family)